MNTPQAYDSEAAFDPLDMVESILTEEGLTFERTPEGDLGFALGGDWRTYEMWFSWRPEGECLQLCCSLDVEGGTGQRLGEDRLAGLYELLCLVNQHVWFGHFEAFRDSDDKGRLYDVVFRHTLAVDPLERGSVAASAHMINSAAEAVDRFYPAFDFWFKGSGSAEAAFAACLFETQGEA
ncbi:YbjN domain-containing protein [Asticcacaulis sp. EMRT-3]|uniref:YbjN domain-containing protein n=1 Tax=Asticcacaulis sp. EMRT-3 TaxID=3040349 RepID=UPI0024AE9904|nr:YbjN domain-containing protein [Asticcacaulis sp. EMRT-3]MDI7774871.1 YbjN domain-containing protein [Asticcacaulis sp. EMRT-3]